MTPTPQVPKANIRIVRRMLVGAALLALPAAVSIQAIGPTSSPAAAAETDACGTVLTKADGSNWACSFVDNFDGSSLNRNKWLVQETAKTGYYSGKTCYVDSSKNIQVTRGELKLVTRKESGKYNCTSPLGGFSSNYTGGSIVQRPEIAQAYGRFEVRAKYPNVTTPGIHGAFWMYPTKPNYGQWPASGEIDIAEWWSSDPTLVLPSLHYPGENFWLDSGWDCRVAGPSNYHTYMVEWLPSGLSFYIDGKMCFSRMPTPDAPLVAPQPFDQPFWMILSMGVGSEGGTNPLTSTTQLPATFTIDYAKAWR